ncbi:MAG: acetyl-CoA carboxylase biotin carboxyl carrier protein subunit [Bacteroidota bacterium]
MNVKVNDVFNYSIEADSGNIVVDGQPVYLDLKQRRPEHSHILFNNRSYNIEIISEDRPAKTCVVKVNGHVYNVAIEDKYDQLLKQLGIDVLQTNKIQEVKAPMPGLVLKVLATQGMEVKKGDSLLILEAMKMENMIKSPTDGIIKDVHVITGDKVEKGQILLQFI